MHPVVGHGAGTEAGVEQITHEQAAAQKWRGLGPHEQGGEGDEEQHECDERERHPHGPPVVVQRSSRLFDLVQGQRLGFLRDFDDFYSNQVA